MKDEGSEVASSSPEMGFAKFSAVRHRNLKFKFYWCECGCLASGCISFGSDVEEKRRVWP